jgi:hypothetical protein
MALDHSCQVQRHTNKERGLDPYFSSSVSIPPLLAVEKIPRNVFEITAGNGALATALSAAGHRVLTADIANYGFPLDYQEDFLTRTEMPPGFNCILTNPPFLIVEQILAHAIQICPLVVMLLRLAFFEAGSGTQWKHQLRRYVLDTVPPARVHCFAKRLPMMSRLNWDGKKANSGMAFAWFVWDRNHVGPTTIDRISWER